MDPRTIVPPRRWSLEGNALAQAGWGSDGWRGCIAGNCALFLVGMAIPAGQPCPCSHALDARRISMGSRPSSMPQRSLSNVATFTSTQEKSFFRNAMKIFVPTIHGLIDRRASRSNAFLLDALPLMVLSVTALILRDDVVPWVFMWAMAFALYGGCKWLTYRMAMRHGASPSLLRTAGYLLAWPGMDAADFLGNRKNPITPQTSERAFALSKMVFGAGLLWGTTRIVFPFQPILAGWIGMIGIVFILHFGLFHLLSLLWRQAGVPATPVMQNPLLAKSLADFWGGRWNTAFNELAFRFTFRPLRRWTTPRVATLGVFILSGFIHELVISMPAWGGYGLPTLYFAIQGLGVIAERSRYGRAIGLGCGARGWIFMFFTLIGPLFWLFHPHFIIHVILPMLKSFGAT